MSNVTGLEPCVRAFVSLEVAQGVALVLEAKNTDGRQWLTSQLVEMGTGRAVTAWYTGERGAQVVEKLLAICAVMVDMPVEEEE